MYEIQYNSIERRIYHFAKIFDILNIDISYYDIHHQI